MDAVGFVAVIGQLVAQVIDLYQQVDTARRAVKTAPKVLHDTTRHLLYLSNILRHIEREKGLYTDNIKSQLEFIKDITNELQKMLESMEILQRKSPLQQGLRALSRGQRDEIKLADVLERLHKAQIPLLLEISLFQIKLTGGLAEEVRKAAWGEEAKTSSPIKTPPTEACGGVKTKVRSLEEEKKSRHDLAIGENKIFGSAHQLNGMIGMESSQSLTKACIMHNQATGMARQQNLMVDVSNASQITHRMCF
ncbi:hypothetical protein F4810DRAFT_694084 [Camillea tinctor]|nr:hypothetical protein F4810DRAFT_694084 [Camillea tinctor]